MLKIVKLITENIGIGKLQTALLFASSSNKAIKWCNQPTGPTSKAFNNAKIFENNGFWGVQNAKKNAFRNYTWVGT